MTGDRLSQIAFSNGLFEGYVKLIYDDPQSGETATKFFCLDAPPARPIDVAVAYLFQIGCERNDVVRVEDWDVELQAYVTRFDRATVDAEEFE
jgi:hypothetical protein